MISGIADKKIFNLQKTNSKELSQFLKTHKKITLVGGCYDVLHYGHISFLKNAKNLGGAVVVLLESDQTIKKKKGRKPIHDQQKRASMLASLLYVDVVIALPIMTSDEEYSRLTRLIAPKFIAVTKGDKYLKNKQKQAQEVGAKVREVIKPVKELSTSLITQYASLSGN